jgi:hypothetical protein
MYRAYFGTPGCRIPGPLEKARWPFGIFSDLGEALVWAGGVTRRRTVVVAIDGDDGTRLSRSGIALRLGRSLV